MSSREIKYRGYTIERNWKTHTGPPQPDEFTFAHEDWDLGDVRIGAAGTLQDCIDQIDDLEDA